MKTLYYILMLAIAIAPPLRAQEIGFVFEDDEFSDHDYIFAAITYVNTSSDTLEFKVRGSGLFGATVRSVDTDRTYLPFLVHDEWTTRCVLPPGDSWAEPVLLRTPLISATGHCQVLLDPGKYTLSFEAGTGVRSSRTPLDTYVVSDTITVTRSDSVKVAEHDIAMLYYQKIVDMARFGKYAAALSVLDSLAEIAELHTADEKFLHRIRHLSMHGTGNKEGRNDKLVAELIKVAHAHPSSAAAFWAVKTRVRGAKGRSVARSICDGPGDISRIRSCYCMSQKGWKW